MSEERSMESEISDIRNKVYNIHSHTSKLNQKLDDYTKEFWELKSKVRDLEKDTEERFQKTHYRINKMRMKIAAASGAGILLVILLELLFKVKVPLLG